MKVFILLSFVAVAFASRQCDVNEHYNSCGTSCPLTCGNYKDAPLICNKMCNPGCHCDEGFVRSEEGRCVRPEQCPMNANQCGINEHYNSCGTSCPLTCGNYKDAPLMCNKMCNPGCHCDNGYVRSEEGRCVRPEQCPLNANKCGQNQHYESCGTACPLTCDNYNNPPRACILMCNPGCHCDKGYVKTADGRCVLPEECPARAVQKTCLDEPDSGICLAYFPMWYYDVKTGKCHEFVYGGCGGNGNRYRTEEECMEHCKAIQLSTVKRCELPSDAGLCRGYFPRYYFDKETGQCQKFVYGGCSGNSNNFLTLEDCKAACA